MDFVTRYRRPSAIETQAEVLLVFLASTPLPGKATAMPEIFSGSVARPLLFRNLLLGLRQTVESRFYRPDWWRLLDPVITAGNRLLRLECFSSCAGVYARADLTENLFEDGLFHRNGTTNVDFNSIFLDHLAALRPGKAARFEMGEQSVKLSTYRGEAVEHKVKLPERWIKGFLQVQAVQRQAMPLFELDRLTARQLLTMVPASSRGPLYLVPTRHRPRVLHRRPAGKDSHIAVEGVQRLRLFQALAADIQALRVYQVPETGASVWVADAGEARFTLGLSSAVSHGFSGDGEALRSLAEPGIDEADLLLCRAAAQSLNHFTLAELSEHQNLPPGRVVDIADRLSSQGLLGYDRDRDRYFYRQLPFMAEDQNQPDRLQNARRLLENEAVEITHCERRDHELSTAGWVRGDDGYYQVSLTIDAQGRLREGLCSCPWIARHALRRGPCKHLLALRFSAEAQA